MRGLTKAVTLFAVALTAAVAIAACGGGGSSSSSTSAGAGSTTSGGGAASSESGGGKEISIDVGEGNLTFPAGTKPKIAFFAGSGTAYEESERKAAEAEARKYGDELTWYDSKFEPATQLKQLQTALSGGEYNAWIVEDAAEKTICSPVQEAHEHGIAVVQVTSFTCEQAGKPAGEEAWTPGTVASVGATGTPTYYESFARELKKFIKTPEPQLGVINGPPTISITQELEQALPGAGLEPVEEVNAEAYLTPEGLSETENMLQAHPDINSLVSVYSDLTVGAVRAIEAADKSGEVEVFDIGGSGESVKLIEEGKVAMTVPYFPASIAEQAVTVLHEAFEGKKVERFYDGFAEGTPEKPFLVTKQNLAEYEPQY